MIPHPGKIRTQMAEGVDIFRVNFQRLPVGTHRFIKSLHFVERQTNIEEPSRVIGIERDRSLKFFQGFGPFMIVEELFGPFDALLGIVPVVHRAMASKQIEKRERWSDSRPTVCGRLGSRYFTCTLARFASA